MARLKTPYFLALLPILAGCAPRTFALREEVSLMARGAPALYEEADPDFAKDAIPAQLKLAEELLRGDPSNEELLLLCAEGFNGYAFLFLEDGQPDRAKGLYARGRDYALRALARRAPLARLSTATLEEFTRAVQGADRNDVPALFWAGFGWAGYVNLAKDNPAAVAALPKAVALMQRVHDLDPDYHFAGSDLFFGTYYASRPAILGGDAAKAKAFFQEARRRTGGKYLMTYVLEARYYAVAAQDQELFKGLLAKVKDAESGALPDARLTDEVAKRKAGLLLEKINDYF